MIAKCHRYCPRLFVLTPSAKAHKWRGWLPHHRTHLMVLMALLLLFYFLSNRFVQREGG